MKLLEYVIFYAILVSYSKSLASPIYRMINLLDNPGIYFERLQDIKYTTSYKKLIFVLNLEDLETTINEFFFKIPSLKLLCETASGECKSDTSDEQKLLRQLSEVKEIYNNSINRLKSDIFDASLPQHEIQQYITGYNISKKISNEILHLPSKYEELKFKLDISITRLNSLIHDMAFTSFNDTRELLSTYNQWINNSESSMDIMIESVKSFSRIIRAARDGNLIDDLFPVKQLDDILREQDKNYFYIKGNIDKLIKIKYNYFNKSIVFVTAIPVLDSENYSLHRIHSLPVFQNTCSMAIKTNNTYIAIGKTKRLHTLPTTENLNSCTNLANVLVCPNNVRFLSGDSCEKSLLLSKYSLSPLCEYESFDNKPDFWELLSNNYGWLYSINEITKFNIICTDRTSFSTNLSGIGILQMNPICRVQNEEFILLGTEVKEIPYVYKGRFQVPHCPVNSISKIDYFPVIFIFFISINMIFMVIIIYFCLHKPKKPKSKEVSTDTQILLTQNPSIQINFNEFDYDVPKQLRSIYQNSK